MRPLVSRDDGEASANDASTKTNTKRRPQGLKFVPALFVVVALGLALQGAFAQTAAAETGVPCPQTGMETVATDAPDYPPGSTVHVTGTGYSPACDAIVQISRPDSVVESFTATTDFAGNLEYDYLLPPPPGVIGEYGLDILGLEGVLASMTFTDAAVTWNGTTSTEWNLGTNWVGGAVPTSSDDVTIPANVASGRYPVVSTAAAIAKSVTLAAGAGTQPSLTVSANTLAMTGNGGLAVSAGTVNETGGTILVGSGPMTVNNGGNVSVSGTGVIHMASNLATVPTESIVVAAGGHIGQSGGSVDTFDFTSSASGTDAYDQGGGVFKIYHDYKSNGTFFAVGGTFEVAGTGGGNAFSSSGQNFWNNVLVDSGVTARFDQNVAMTINVGGNWTNNGAVNLTG